MSFDKSGYPIVETKNPNFKNGSVVGQDVGKLWVCMTVLNFPGILKKLFTFLESFRFSRNLEIQKYKDHYSLDDYFHQVS